MTVNLSPDSLSAALRSELTQQLQTVNDRIKAVEEELPGLLESRCLLERVIAATNVDSPDPAQVPTARQAEPREPEPASGSQPPPTKSDTGPDSSRSTTRRTAKSGRSSSHKAKAQLPEGVPYSAEPSTPDPSQGAVRVALSLPQRVLAHLVERNEPASTKEICESLFTGSLSAGRTTQVRTAAESLVKRGLVERLRQGAGVFYQPTQGAHASPSATGEVAIVDAS